MVEPAASNLSGADVGLEPASTNMCMTIELRIVGQKDCAIRQGCQIGGAEVEQGQCLPDINVKVLDLVFGKLGRLGYELVSIRVPVMPRSARSSTVCRLATSSGVSIVPRAAVTRPRACRLIP